MFSLRRTTGRRLFFRRSRIVLVLFAYLATVFGFPHYSARSSNEIPASVCGGDSCGCDRDAVANGSCCCAGKRTSNAIAPEPTPVSEPCCAPEASACCETDQNDVPAPGSDAIPVSVVHSPKRSPWRWVSGISAMHCLGVSVLWITTGAVLPLPTIGDCARFNPCVQWLSLENVIACPIPLTPPDPPPRFAPA